jgi:pimeloyl-ACP methyl ester carboxylesterase
VTEYKVVIDGIPTHYYVMNPRGKRTILLVHGFTGDHAGLAQIAQHWHDYKIITPDLPGHGKTPPMDNDRHTIEGYGRWVRRFMNALDLEPLILIGHSFGASVAARTAADSPQGIEQLILINPVTESSRGFAFVARAYFGVGLGMPEGLGRRWFKSRTASRVKSWLMMTTRDPQLRAAIYRHHLNDLEFPYYRKVVADVTASVVGKNVLVCAPTIAVPTLLIGGDQDDLAPLAAQRRLNQLIPRSQLVIIAGVGHLTHLEKSAEVAAMVQEYLNG